MLKLRNPKGATLIETLGSVLIFMIGIEALLAVYFQSVNMGKRSEYAYTAYNLARNHIERLKVGTFSDIASAVESNELINSDGDPDPSGQYLRTTTVATNYSGNANLTQVTVSISWLNRGVQSPGSMQVSSVIYNGG